MNRYLHFLLLSVGAAALSTVVFCGSARADMFVPDQELLDSWGVLRIGAGLVHNMGVTGAGVKIGIIDSGIDTSHPEFAGRIAGGYNFVNNTDNFFDSFGHGTQVAGIIGAADDGLGVVGVAPGASLYAYKVYDSSTNVGTFDLVRDALARAISDGVQVVNVSLGSIADPGLVLADAFIQAMQAGITIVASAGNDGLAADLDGNIRFPAAYDSVIAVGATDMLDVRSDFSSTGPELELVAPGEGIRSTDTFSLGQRVYLDGLTGTSFAAPHVAGAAALLIQAGYADIRGRLITTAFDLGDPGFDQLYGYGLVDAHAAVVPVPSALVLALMGISLVYKKCRSGK